MVIRIATESDIPQIIELLRVSLGESMIPKSEALWGWKHLSNPFGPSPVILAESDGQLLGVRAFLRWEFRDGDRIFSACRAVDTAIHPDYQGQGLFKKLTLELIETLQQEGIDLIFNTPNSSSLPGYLKMGWEKWGKLPLKLDFHFHTGKNQHPLNPESWELIEQLVGKLESQASNAGGIQTNLVPGYLTWRYHNCPLFPYYFLSDGNSYLLFYRIKEGKMGRELRITDFFKTAALLPETKNELQVKLKKVQKKAKVRFTSYSGLQFNTENELELGVIPLVQMGPLVTLRPVCTKVAVLDQKWNWSLGDLEVF